MSDVLVIDSSATTSVVAGGPAGDVLVIDEQVVGFDAVVEQGLFLVEAPMTTGVVTFSPTTGDFFLVDTQPPPVAQMVDGASDFIVIASAGPRGNAGIQGIQGVQGLQGLPGDPVGAVAYAFTQLGSSALWDIFYPLGYEPSVTVVETSGGEIEGDVHRLALGHMHITFGLPVSGIAYLC